MLLGGAVGGLPDYFRLADHPGVEWSWLAYRYTETTRVCNVTRQPDGRTESEATRLI